MCKLLQKVDGYNDSRFAFLPMATTQQEHPDRVEFQDTPTVREVAEKLLAASEKDRLGPACSSLRGMRDALLLQGYLQGYTLDEVAKPFGLTRERARQLINRILPARSINKIRKRLPKPRQSVEASLERGRQKRMSGELQKHADRNAEIERLVETGISYSEVAENLGVTRNVICTVMYRARHRDHLRNADGKYPLIAVLPHIRGRNSKGGRPAR